MFIHFYSVKTNSIGLFFIVFSLPKGSVSCRSGALITRFHATYLPILASLVLFAYVTDEGHRCDRNGLLFKKPFNQCQRHNLFFFLTLLLSLANLLENNASSPMKATDEISTETFAETQSKIAVRRGTLEKIRIQPAEGYQNQMADGSEIFVSENTRSPSANETRTFTVEGTETQVTAEAQVPSAKETSTRTVEAAETGATGVSKIPSMEKTHTHATIESTNLAKDETQVPLPEEAYNRTEITAFTYALDTEDAEIDIPETYEVENTREEGEPSILNGK